MLYSILGADLYISDEETKVRYNKIKSWTLAKHSTLNVTVVIVARCSPFVVFWTWVLTNENLPLSIYVTLTCTPTMWKFILSLTPCPPNEYDHPGNELANPTNKHEILVNWLLLIVCVMVNSHKFIAAYYNLGASIQMWNIKQWYSIIIKIKHIQHSFPGGLMNWVGK